MQKIMVCVQRPDSIEQTEWNREIKNLAEASIEGNIQVTSYALIDKDVAPAHLLEMRYTEHPKDALFSIWSDNLLLVDPFLKSVAILGKFQAYAVMESAAIPHHPKAGRVDGMCQIALLKKPKTQARLEWQQAWLGEHTKVAIDTQSTFGYRQNVVALTLPLEQATQTNWPLMDAIVEENFPATAMTSREAFFAAEGDPEKFEHHQQIMMQSCFKFIDFEAFDCVPMSQYIVAGE